MARPSHYSPVISRFLVCVLYHEAQRRKIPMTQLVDDLLRQSLSGSEAWLTAIALSLAADPPPSPTSAKAA